VYRHISKYHFLTCKQHKTLPTMTASNARAICDKDAQESMKVIVIVIASIGVIVFMFWAMITPLERI
jgi:hypothetical protein